MHRHRRVKHLYVGNRYVCVSSKTPLFTVLPLKNRLEIHSFILLGLGIKRSLQSRVREFSVGSYSNSSIADMVVGYVLSRARTSTFEQVDRTDKDTETG